MRQIIDFMRRLDADNDREWFDAHRTEWQGVRKRIADTAERLIAGLSSFDPSVRGLRPQDCTYRIARDTRFSPDKTPYKNWVGIFVCPRGKKSGYAGYYLHIAPTGDPLLGGHMLVSGLYCPQPNVLRSVRDEIFRQRRRIRRNDRSGEGLRARPHQRPQTHPGGLPLRLGIRRAAAPEGFLPRKNVTEEFLCAGDMIERTVAEFRRTQPFLEILNRAVRYAYEEMS